MKASKYFLPLIWLVLLVRNGSSQEFIGPHGYLTIEAEISSKDSVGRRGTFDLHHFNLIGNYILTGRARVFGEIEWEHGTDSDSREGGGNKAGFVRVERAWFEYEFSEKFKLRLGKFLTPYGIYNEIHDAAPAYDTSVLPQSIYGKHENPFGQIQRFYAKFAIGALVTGTLEFGRNSLQYKVLVSNGRGAAPFEQDDNNDKGIGLRLLSDLQDLNLKIGYSVYSDRNGLARQTRQTSQVWDLRFEHGKLRWNAEFARVVLGTAGTAPHDQISNAGYGEIAYQLLTRQTILARYDIFDPNTHRASDVQRDLTIGTSIQVLRQTLAKAELHFRHEQGTPNSNYVLAIASLAVVF